MNVIIKKFFYASHITLFMSYTKQFSYCPSSCLLGRFYFQCYNITLFPYTVLCGIIFWGAILNNWIVYIYSIDFYHSSLLFFHEISRVTLNFIVIFYSFRIYHLHSEGEKVFSFSNRNSIRLVTFWNLDWFYRWFVESKFH